MDETFNKLMDVLHESMPDTDTSRVTRQSDLVKDIGLDSLNMMLLAMVIEEKFQIHFETGFNPSTVDDLCVYIEKASK